MITEIGLTVGDVLMHLEENIETTLDNMIKEIRKDKDLILMSLGWLAREGHILIEKGEKEYKIVLPKNSDSINWRFDCEED